MTVIKTAKKIIAFMACVAIVFAAAPAAVNAADTPVIETQDPDDAVKGSVVVRGAVQTGYTPTIHVELIPESEEGSVHTYTLSIDNEYEITDQIMIGQYGCVCYCDKEDSYKSDVTVMYGGPKREVMEGDGQPPVFVVVAGSPSFVNEYEWISDYRSNSGEYPKGYISQSDAENMYRTMIARDSGDTADAVGEEEAAPPEEYESPAVSSTQKAEEEEPAPEIVGNEPGVWEKARYFAIIGGSVITLIFAAFLSVCTLIYDHRKRNGEKEEEGPDDR